MQKPTTSETLEAARPGWIRVFIGLTIVLAAGLALAATTFMFGWPERVSELMRAGWGPWALPIMRNKIAALWQGSLLSLACGLLAWLSYYTKISRRALRMIGWGLVLLVAADAVYLARHYVQSMPQTAFAENDVIRLLKTAQPEGRVALISQSGFYNTWLTYQFPYHGIQTINLTQMPRMPLDYKRFLEALGPPRLWQLSAVEFILAPAQFWGQLQQDAQLREACDLIYAYNVVLSNQTVQVLPATRAKPGQHVVLRLKKPAPRFSLLAGWETLGDDAALERLAAPGQPLFEKALLAPGSTLPLQESTGQGLLGSIQLRQLTAHKIILDVSSERAAILRIANKYDAAWQAWVDEQARPLLRVDYIFQGVYIEPGRHEVVLRYAPPLWPLLLQGLGLLSGLGAIWILLHRRPQNRPSSLPANRNLV